LNDRVLETISRIEADFIKKNKHLSTQSADNEIEVEDDDDPNKVSIVSTSVNCTEEEAQLIKDE